MLNYKNKYELVRDLLKQEKAPYQSLLDVGCRDCILKPYLKDLVKEYKGVDLYQNETNSVDFVCNFERGLNMPNASYDCVTALDLVEHLNNLQGGVDELVRISKKEVMIMLPNIAHAFFRFKFFLTGKISDKYTLKYGMGEDRHRWVTILPETDQYMRDYCRAKGLRLEIIYFTSGKFRLLQRVGEFLHLSPALYVWSTLYRIKKP